VLIEAVRLVSVGAAIGMAGALVSTRLLRGMLYEIDPLDPVAIAGAALLLVGVSALAAYLPARRATRIDATAMLRSQ
jgi:ABC-type lipoprotein release transport system permease subunit